MVGLIAAPIIAFWISCGIAAIFYAIRHKMYVSSGIGIEVMGYMWFGPIVLIAVWLAVRKQRRTGAPTR